MTTEYWLQKKTIGGWSQVSWWDINDFTKAEAAYFALVKSKGYSVRLVRVETAMEAMLDEVVEVAPPVVEPIKSSWGNPPADAPKSSGWSSTASGWGNAAVINPGAVAPPSAEAPHGLSGSVWVINHQTRHKSRVPASELASYLTKGYIKAGPRTQFEG